MFIIIVKVVGMITRHDLTHEHLHKAQHAKPHNNGANNADKDGELDVTVRLRSLRKTLSNVSI